MPSLPTFGEPGVKGAQVDLDHCPVLDVLHLVAPERPTGPQSRPNGLTLKELQSLGIWTDQGMFMLWLIMCGH